MFVLCAHISFSYLFCSSCEECHSIICGHWPEALISFAEDQNVIQMGMEMRMAKSVFAP